LPDVHLHDTLSKNVCAKIWKHFAEVNPNIKISRQGVLYTRQVFFFFSTTQSQNMKPIPTILSRWLPFLAATIFFLVAGLAAPAVNLVQDFYLPMPESQIYTANSAIVSGAGSTIASTFSIVVTGDGTVIYYDQWEDGYETDLSNPTQPTTQIWGDGNDAHGIPPGFAHNPLGLTNGTVITLTNNVTLPRNPSTILWDARDHIAANKALVITRAAWPIPTGPVFAGSVGVLSTIDYGTNYISPVGQNLANNLFKYVGMFIMAAQNNTAVTIDPTGTNGAGVTNIILNQGESYLVNGGIMKGGRVTSSKGIQADLLIGHVGASYASDWFTLYPVAEWSSSYYTPVGSAAKVNQPAYVYLYNPGTSAITINYSTQVGSGSFSVPGTNGVFQFQMPVGSGASFVCTNGNNFYALCTVAANNSADVAYNWGFTLVPQGALTTEDHVGWAPGSADGTVDGSPVWVTALANTTLYVDYKGDHLGPLAYTNGGNIQNYDTNFTVTALQSLKIFDPSKNQTGMRIFTVDGTLITAAWGEDPDTAQPGNPYIDAGTTVIPFPVPVLKKTVAITATNGSPSTLVGDTLQYTVEVDNKGLLPLGNTVVIDTPTTNLTYVTNSTTFNGSPIPDNPGPYSSTNTAFPLDAYGSAGYTIPIIQSQGTSTFQYTVKVIASGTVSNSVNIGGTSIFTQTYLPPPPTNGASVALTFSTSGGVATSSYVAGASVYVTMTNAVGNTASNSVQTINVTVTDTNTGDVETIPLVETGTNTGIFRNTNGLPTSTAAGIGAQDGTLYVVPGDTISVSYTDPNFGDSASATAVISIPAPNKQLYLSATNAMNRMDPVHYGYVPMLTSVDLGSSGSGVITVAATTFGSSAGATSLTVPHVPGAGANRLMLVSVMTGASSTTGNDATTVSSVTFAGTNLSLVGVTNDPGTRVRCYIYGLTNPPAASNNVVISLAASRPVYAGVTTFNGVNQSTPLGTVYRNAQGAATGGTGVTFAGLTNIVSAPGELVYDALAVDIDGTVETLTPGTNQTKLWVVTNTSTVLLAGSSTKPGALLVTNNWTWGLSDQQQYGMLAVSIKPAAAGGGGTNVTSFAQTPVFQSAFTMPAGGTVTITNFITITNGTLPANPNITATLQYGGTNFLTLSNPVYNSGAGVNTNLVWTGTLAASVTLPPGTNITYVISNYQSTATFHVNYASTNAPSVIVLPATTVIQVSALGVYDAPYTNGNLVTSPAAGSTLYIRAAVTDPFGYYDITSLGLAVTNASAGVGFTTNLTDVPFAVYTNGATKIYEYQWVTGPATGSYSIAATAHEGTEGVSASAVASITTTFLDLGTPSTTEFTAGPNGVATNNYPATGLVSVRVSDLNRNTNAATVDTILVTVTSSGGDSETFTLVETGTNTGIFTNSINVSTNILAMGVTNNGTLYAPVGSILTASYSDPTDPTDNTSATATVLPLPGVSGVNISKTIISPSGGQAGINQPVTYNLRVVNTGNTTLANVVVTDNYPSTRLNYVSASPAPNTAVTGVLTWNTLGAFAPGQSTNLTVNFTTSALTGTATNSATANGGTATNTTAVTLLVNNAAVNVTKTLLSPTNTPVAIGSNVVFRITVQNVGNTVINYLPLEDAFSGAYYQFVSSTITNNGSGAGSLVWTNLAAPTPLATNAILTNDVTMKVVGQGTPANNSATVDYATDIFGNPVPTSSSTIGVNTIAAAINGHVYNDINQSGIYTNGDTGLASVTLTLYTDPTGTGTPGALVQITTSDANGYYELLNLGIGRYVAVETLLPGYAGSAPPNGRLAFNLTTLTASTNNNFFQYIPALSSYSTISGTVWYDANGNGTNNAGETNLANVEIDLVQDVNSNGLAEAGEPVVSSATTDANGNYSLAGITLGHYVIRQTLPYGYYSSGNSQGRRDSQISFVSTNGVVSTNNSFYDRLPPIAVNDTNSALYFVPATLYPLTNDISPNGDPLTITNVTSANGIVVINPGGTNLTFTPTNMGATTITYTISDGHGGSSTAVITVNVTALADVGLGKSALGSVLATNNLTYAIAVTNFGPSGAGSVVVTDTLPAGVTFVSASGSWATNNGVVNWSLGTLTNTQITNLTLIVTAPAGGSLTNVASVSSPTPDPNLTNNVTPPVVTGVTPVTDVVVLNAGPGSVVAGTVYTNTIAVTNAGPSVATNVVVVDTLPNGTTVTNTYPVLAAGGGTNFTVTFTAPGSGPLTNSATGTSGTYDPNWGNNTNIVAVTAVTASANVGLGKSALGSVLATNNLTYAIAVTNFGPSSASSVVVTDALPAGVTFVSASGGWATNNGVVNWSLGTLTNTQITNLTLIVTAPAGGSLTNVASVNTPTPDPNLTNNVTPPVVTVVTPVADVAAGKSASATVLATNNLTYAIAVTNFGPSSASSVVVTDTLPAGVTFVSASGSWATNNGVVNWSLGTLTNTQITNLLLIVTAPAGGSLTNVASVSTPTGDPNLTNNVTPPVVTGVIPVADVVLGKSGPAGITYGTNFNYTISVTNFGPSTATGISVTDSVPAGLVFVSALPAASTNGSQVIWTNLNLVANATSNLILTVTSTALGTVTNIATGGSPTLDPNPTNNTSPPVVTVISKGQPVVTWPVPTNLVYGTPLGTNQNDATATVPGTFNYNPTNGVILPVGTNVLGVVFTPTDPNYVSTNLTVLLVVTPAPLTITANSTNKAYGTTLTLGAGQTAFTSSGLVNSETIGSVTLASTGALGAAAAGDYALVPSLATGGTFNPANYSLTYSNGTLTVTKVPLGITANATNRVYGAANPTFTYTATGFVNGDTTNVLSGSPSITTTATTNSAVGNYIIAITNGTLSAANYSISFNDFTNGILAVTPAPLTITANSTNKVYNTTLVFAGTEFSTSALVAGDSVTNVSLASAGAGSGAGVGSYSIIPSGAVGKGLTNYSLTYSNGVLTVGPGIYTAGWPVPTNLVYGTPLGTNQNAATATVPGNFVYNPTNGVILPVGTNVLGVVFTPTDTNYVGTNLTVQLVVTPAPLTITANNLVRGYGQTNPPLTYTITGFVNGEHTNVVAGSPVLNTTAVSNSPAGMYPITISQGSLVATNYSFTFTNGLLTVTNIPPVANAQLAVASENIALPITLTGTDPNLLPLTYVIVNNPAHGTLGLLNTNTGAVTYTPATNYLGGDSFTFLVNNGQTSSVPATVSITVLAPTNADVQVTLFGPNLVTVGDAFAFTTVVTNAGPATAVNTRATNALPANLVFSSATGGGVVSNGVVTWPVLPSLVNGQATNLAVTVKTVASGSTISPTANPFNFILTNSPPTISSATNRASAYAATFDPNLTNNTASAFYTNAQAQTLIVPGVFSVVLETNTYPTNVNAAYTIIPIIGGTNLFIAGTNAFNPQTQLYEEFVSVTNIGQAVVHALRLSIGGLRSGVTLYNATGTNNGVPYVEYDPPYDSPLNPYPQANNSVTFTLEFFVADRRPFTNSLTATAIIAPVTSPVNGIQVNIIQQGFNDQRNPGNWRYLVEFTSIPGRTYTVEYTDDFMVTWHFATPSILASTTSTFWYDDGPPVTLAPPPNTGGNATSRLYRVLLNP
jgi:uncharacterized repeat protein (TIGR01451 family)